MFRLSLSHPRGPNVQIHIKNVLCIVGSPTLTVSVVRAETCSPAVTLYVLYLVLLCLTLSIHCILQTHTLQYITPIASPLQRWLHDRAPVLRHTYIARPVIY